MLLLSAAIAGGLTAAAEAATVTCAAGGGNTPSGWTLYGVGGGVAATAAPFISPSGAATDCYIVTDSGAGWPGTEPTGFDIKSLPGVPTIDATTNGSAMASPIFTAGAGAKLHFNFAFITNDGTETFSDWAAAFLQPVDGEGNATGPSLNLFTARTGPSNEVIPGWGISGFPSGLVLTPSNASIQGDTFFLNGATGGTDPLDPNATQYGPGRYPDIFPDATDPGGSSPWIDALFTFDETTAGRYQLVMAVGNTGDEIYASGLLFAGTAIAGGDPIDHGDEVPEPMSAALLAIGLLAIGIARRTIGS